MALNIINRSSVGGDTKVAANITNLSYRFELVTNGMVIASFTMGLPPQSFTRSSRLRAAFDKTYGGAALELGRADNDVIMMKGSFAGNKLHAWYGGKQQTGMDAYKAFKEKILLFTERKQSALFNKKNIPRTAIKFYDLYSGDNHFVHITQFTLDRDATKPLWWNYTINMVKIDKPDADENALDAFLKAVNDVKGAVEDVTNTVAEFGALTVSYCQQVNAIVSTATATVGAAFDMADTAIAAATGVLQEVSTLTANILEVPSNFLSGVENTLLNARAMVAAVQEIGAQWGTLGTGEYAKALGAQWQQIEAVAASIVAFAEIEVKKTASGLIIDPRTSSVLGTANKPSAGYQRATTVATYKVAAGDTVESVALATYGSEQYANIIADYNGLNTTALAIGQELKLPTFEDSVIPYVNTVYSRELDMFGSDIKLSDTGGIVASSTGDALVVSGIDCLAQNLQARYSFEVGQLRSDPTYGYDKAMIGRKMTAEQLMLAQIKAQETLEAEPRIKEVTSIAVVFTDTGTQIEAQAVLQDDFILPITLKVG